MVLVRSTKRNHQKGLYGNDFVNSSDHNNNSSNNSSSGRNNSSDEVVVDPYDYNNYYECKDSNKFGVVVNYFYAHLPNFEKSYNINYVVEDISFDDIFLISIMDLWETNNNNNLLNLINDLLKIYEEEKKKKIYICTSLLLKIFKRIIKKKSNSYFLFNIYKAFENDIKLILDSINILIKKWVVWTFKNCDNIFNREKNINIKKLVKLFFISFYKYLKNYFLQIYYHFFYNNQIYNRKNYNFDNFFFSIFSKYINKIFVEIYSSSSSSTSSNSSFVFNVSKFYMMKMCISIINNMIGVVKYINLERVKQVFYEHNIIMDVHMKSHLHHDIDVYYGHDNSYNNIYQKIIKSYRGEEKRHLRCYKHRISSPK